MLAKQVCISVAASRWHAACDCVMVAARHHISYIPALCAAVRAVRCRLAGASGHLPVLPCSLIRSMLHVETCSADRAPASCMHLPVCTPEFAMHVLLGVGYKCAVSYATWHGHAAQPAHTACARTCPPRHTSCEQLEAMPACLRTCLLQAATWRRPARSPARAPRRRAARPSGRALCWPVGQTPAGRTASSARPAQRRWRRPGPCRACQPCQACWPCHRGLRVPQRWTCRRTGLRMSAWAPAAMRCA